MVKNLWSLGWEDPLEKGLATHCSGDCHYLSCTLEQTRKPERAKGFPKAQGSCLTGALNTDLSLN